MRSEADVVVVGAGLGGLLAAVRLARRGKRVIVIERADRAGGRFTATPLKGAEVSTGALHLVPHGSGGALARMLRDLEVDVPMIDADVFASFWVDGRHIVCRRAVDVLRVLRWADRVRLPWLGARFVASRFAGSCDAWLRRSVAPESRVYQIAQAFAEFALSLRLEVISYRDFRAVLLTTWRLGLPGVPRGGCRGLIDALVDAVRNRDGAVLLDREVTTIFRQDRHVTGVLARQRKTGSLDVIDAPLVVSNLGPSETLALCSNGSPLPLAEGVTGLPAACGLKIQFLSPRSLIPHRSIMFCLGTERVAGIAQPSNADPSLAPPGQHLVMSHQVLKTSDARAERAAGLRDLRRIFGPAFDRCTILSAGRFSDSWPVNRAAQGHDVLEPPSIEGLHWVGDAYKPSGYMMVEGVAESVRRLPI